MDNSKISSYNYHFRLTRRTSIVLGFILCTAMLFYFTDGWTAIEKYRDHPSLNILSSQCIETPKKLEQKCQWYFLNYTPSAWENTWYHNIPEYQKNVCETLANPENLKNTVSAVERLVEVRKFGRKQTASNKQNADELLSRMFYRYECLDAQTNATVAVTDVAHLIEPLIGLLRDPFTICSRIETVAASLYEGYNVQSKRVFLMGISAPLYEYSLSQNHPTSSLNDNILPWMYQRARSNLLDTQIKTREPQRILIDLGSTYFGTEVGDSTGDAGRWFYEYYKRFNQKFDRIIAYEHAPLDTKVAWEILPDDVFPVFTLINVGCAVAGRFNPWNMLQAIAKPYDHVVVKLDIDTSEIEIPLINDMVEAPNIFGLIDEMFFEHHITVKDMMPYWGSPPGTLQDSYLLFTKIRQRGIRMHAWP